MTYIVVAYRKEAANALTGALSACKLEAYIWGARLKPWQQHRARSFQAQCNNLRFLCYVMFSYFQFRQAARCVRQGIPETL